MDAPSSVFLNCPFDQQYEPIFATIVFTTYACGFRPRSALEDDGSGLIRFDRLRDLVKECDFGIHDLSRTETTSEGLPRFNMPFELGLYLGAKAFGGPRQKEKQTLVLVHDRHALGKYLSDLAGVDPVEHGSLPENALQAVRDFFQRSLSARATRSGISARRLPGAGRIQHQYREFRSALPAIARDAGFAKGKLNPLASYVDFSHAVVDFLGTT